MSNSDNQTIVTQFRNAIERTGWQYLRLRHPDGVTHHGIDEAGDFSRSLFLVDRKDYVTIRGSLWIPSLQTTSHTLFGTSAWTGNKIDAHGFACVESSPKPTKVMLLAREMNATAQDIADQLLRLKQPGDIGPFLAYRHLRCGRDWRGLTAYHWISLAFLSQGKEAAQAEIESEMRWMRRLTPYNLLGIAVTRILSPNSRERDFQRLEYAHALLKTLKLPDFDPARYQFTVDHVERD